MTSRLAEVNLEACKALKLKSKNLCFYWPWWNHSFSMVNKKHRFLDFNLGALHASRSTSTSWEVMLWVCKWFYMTMRMRREQFHGLTIRSPLFTSTNAVTCSFFAVDTHFREGSLKGLILHDFRNNSVFEPHRARRMCFGDLGVLATCSACITYPRTNLVWKNIRYNLFIFDSLRKTPPLPNFEITPFIIIMVKGIQQVFFTVFGGAILLYHRYILSESM